MSRNRKTKVIMQIIHRAYHYVYDGSGTGHRMIPEGYFGSCINQLEPGIGVSKIIDFTMN